MTIEAKSITNNSAEFQEIIETLCLKNNNISLLTLVFKVV